MNTSTNYHMNRAIELSAAENRPTALDIAIEQENRVINRWWAFEVAFLWVIAMVVVWFKTIYAATAEGAGPVAGLSVFVPLGLLVTAMFFAVWYRNS